MVTNCFAGFSLQWVDHHASEHYFNGIEHMPKQVFMVETSDDRTGGFGILALMLMKLDSMRADILTQAGVNNKYSAPTTMGFFDDGGDSSGPTTGGGAGRICRLWWFVEP
jgi:hypothetical protein